MSEHLTDDETYQSGVESWESPVCPVGQESDEIESRPRRGFGVRILRKTAILPASFTLMNGLCGFGAIHFAAKSAFGESLTVGAVANLQISCWLLVLAMVFDMLDGRVARMTRQTTEFGAQLDSLCDALSFGAAPAFIVLRLTISLMRDFMEYLPVERAVWVISAVYVACAILRLARFNVETDTDESSHMDFHGLPSPGAAAAIAGTVMLLLHLWNENLSWLPREAMIVTMAISLPLLTLGTGLLMVSRFEYPHLINHYIRGARPFSYLVKIVLVLLLVVVFQYITLAILAVTYAASGPLRAVLIKLGLGRAKRQAEL